jgi:hypothetical protein
MDRDRDTALGLAKVLMSGNDYCDQNGDVGDTITRRVEEEDRLVD